MARVIITVFLEYSFPDQPCMSFAWVLFQQELIFSLEYRYRYLSTLGTGTYLGE